MVYAIDPGTEKSGWVAWSLKHKAITNAGVIRNEDILKILEPSAWIRPGYLWIERFEGRGMRISKYEIDAIHWAGRFFELGRMAGFQVERVYRREVKLELLGSSATKDADIRRRLIDLVGPQFLDEEGPRGGKRRIPGPTYGVKTDAWAALAVALYADRALRGALEYVR